jgi:hypothetical protein
MRVLLKECSRKWNLGSIAEDISNAITHNHQRTTALDMARRLGGENADDSVTAGLAKTLASNLSGGREAGVSGSALEDFMNGKGDLSAAAKQQLARILYGNHIRFDPDPDGQYKRGTVTPFATKISTPYRHPDARIRAAQDELHAAIKVRQPARRAGSTVDASPQPQASWPPKRPGFA